MGDERVDDYDRLTPADGLAEDLSTLCLSGHAPEGGCTGLVPCPPCQRALRTAGALALASLDGRLTARLTHVLASHGVDFKGTFLEDEDVRSFLEAFDVLRRELIATLRKALVLAAQRASHDGLIDG